jgi:DNA-binding HxlR family transcriptional regulator
VHPTPIRGPSEGVVRTDANLVLILYPVGCANTIPLKIGQFAQAAEFIHPKWLTIRLRQLEHEGIVTREQLPGRREVWYELTEKGRDLAPVLEALVAWGLKYERHPLDQARLHTPST